MGKLLDWLSDVYAAIAFAEADEHGKAEEIIGGTAKEGTAG